MTTNLSPAEQISRDEGRGTAALWFAVLGAPSAWVLHMAIGYSLEEWFACSPSAVSAGEVAGLSVRSVAVLITVVGALVPIAAGLVAVRCLRRIVVDPGEGSTRARWMAIVGIMNSVLYLVIIVGGLGPALLLQVCEASP